MLGRCLRSLAAQSRPADEIVVVDNGSIDNSIEVARSYGARVIAESRPGITAAASAGYDAATADIIARCDADSVLPTDWLATIESAFHDHPDAVAVTGRGEFYDLGRVQKKLADVLYMRAYFLLAGAALASTPLFGSNFAIRAGTWHAIAETVPRDKPFLHDDFDLSFRLDPGRTVRYHRHLVVGISGRPFHDVSAMRRRVDMAVATIREHLPEQHAVSRWSRRIGTGQTPFRGPATRRPTAETEIERLGR